MSSAIRLVRSDLPKQLKQSLITGLTDLHKVTELSLNWLNLLFISIAITDMILMYALKVQLFVPPLETSWLHSKQCGCIFQGQWILLLCRDWSLHRQNRTLCNYSMPLIPHVFKTALLPTTTCCFHGCKNDQGLHCETCFVLFFWTLITGVVAAEVVTALKEYFWHFMERNYLPSRRSIALSCVINWT